MNNKTDEKVIGKFITWCIENDQNQSRMAEVAKMSRAWASLLVNGKIKSLSFDTRNRIKKIIGDKD